MNIRILWNSSPKEVIKIIRNKLSSRNKKNPYDYTLDIVLKSNKHMNVQHLIDRWERYWRVCNNQNGKNLKSQFSFNNKNIFELGCGPLFGWGPIAMALGADTYYYHDPGLRRDVALSKILKEKYFQRLFDELKSEYALKINFDEYYQKVNNNILPMTDDMKNLDMVLSNSTLEHIPIDKLNSLLSFLKNTCNSGAVYFHAVDFGPHYIDGKDLMLLYKKNKDDNTSDLNLLRKSEIEEYLVNNDFSLFYSIVYHSNIIDRNEIHQTWAEYSDIDLTSRVVFFIGGCNIE
jgi:hypothetical protein